jgi:diguanylate cyclase (GGDEF)-like protein
MLNSNWINSDIDRAALEVRTRAPLRVVAGLVCAFALAIDISPIIGALWLALRCAADVYVAKAEPQPQTTARRAWLGRVNYLAATGLSSAAWTCVAGLDWFTGHAGLRVCAVLIALGQLIHAQAFAYNSRAVLAASALCPCVALGCLPLLFDHLGAAELASVYLAVGFVLLYTAASVRSTVTTARALRASREELSEFAYCDSLTMLANRRMLTQDFRRLAALSQVRGTRFAAILVDLDRFKAINDNFGHDAGDTVLVAVAERLRKLVRSTDCLARMGGDEFAILMPDVPETGLVEAFCQRVVEAFEDPVIVKDCKLHISPSIGCAIFPDDGASQDALFKAADVALYTAKHGGRNTWRAFGTQGDLDLQALYAVA